MLDFKSKADKVREWHGHHTPEYCKDELQIEPCRLYEAIKQGVSDAELVTLALDVDPDCVETEGE
jgi:hypothetical protein